MVLDCTFCIMGNAIKENIKMEREMVMVIGCGLMEIQKKDNGYLGNKKGNIFIQ